MKNGKQLDEAAGVFEDDEAGVDVHTADTAWL
jgi:hypothetical protein